MLSFGQLSPEQEVVVDSLKQVIKTAKHDSIIINAWVEWDNLVYRLNPELDLELNEKIETLTKQKLQEPCSNEERDYYLRRRSSALNIIGINYKKKGDFYKAISYYKECSAIRKELNDQKGYAATLNNIGIIHFNQGNYPKALNNYMQGLQILEKVKDLSATALTLNNIGNIYFTQGEYDQSIEYYGKCLKIHEQLADSNSIGLTLINLGNSYKAQGDYVKAIDIYNQSLRILNVTQDQHLLANLYNNLGTCYHNRDDFNTAEAYYLKSLTIKEELEEKKGISTSLNNLGDIYGQKHQYALGINYCQRSLALAQELASQNRIKESSKSLYKLYKEIGNFDKALDMYEIFVISRDSLESEENQKEVIRQEYKYLYEKQATADSIKAKEEAKVKDAILLAEQAENKKNKLEANQQKKQRYYLYGGLALAILFVVFIFNRFRATSKQKIVIEEQKQKVDEAFNELAEKNNEILDSINYAKRIQNAILPPAKVVKEYLPESFILYKPKDIVAGDFYWLEHKEGKVLFAAADCTGHGVPGAMVSVVCNNGLNRSVREYGLVDPGEILDKTREIVIQEFEKSKEEVKDGMDIALCSLKGNTLLYAGAHNPLWIIRNGEVLETKANKQPIGKFDKQLPYTTHTFELEKGDSIYIFSDGYVDQFGGVKGKKFKSKAFRELLLSIQSKTMEEQRVLIDEAFETWRGNLEQIDDVCVIGVRI